MSNLLPESQNGTLNATDTNFIEHALEAIGVAFKESGFASARTEDGEYVYHERLEGRPLPVVRFALWGVDPIVGGKLVQHHRNYPIIGCAQIVATRDADRVLYAANSNEPLREVSLGEAVDLLIERRQAVAGGAA